MKTTFYSLTACTLLIAGFTVPARSDTPQISASDLKFASKAAIVGMMEVKMGEIAETNAQAQNVKDFGALMVTDHGPANAKLQAIASQKGIVLPKTLPPKKQQMVDECAKLSGAEFDRSYVMEMVEGHRKDVASFKMAQKTLTDPDLKEFAVETLPIIEGHLSKIESIQTEMNRNQPNQTDTKPPAGQ